MSDGSYMVSRRSLFIVLMSLAISGTGLGAEPTGKISNTKGLEAPVVLGVITEVDGKVLTVKVPGIEKNQTLERKITITDKTSISYLDITDKAQQIPKVGYNIKGLADENRLLLKSAILSPPIGEPIKLGPERLTMSNEKLFAKVDTDGNGKVSYSEFSVTIEMSPKHGPNDFQAADKNKDNFLDPGEFLERMKAVTWWRLSRKSPGEYFKSSDKDANGKLSMKEFGEIGAGHLDAVFPRCDKDKSGSLDEKEVIDYINRVINE